MIEFTKMKDTDIKPVINFLKNHDLYEKGIEKSFPNFFIIKEKKDVYGFSIIELNHRKCIIKEMFVSPLKRNLKYAEGLLRTFLNYSSVQGIEDAYYLGENQEIYNYLLKLGFTKTKKDNIDRALYINIEDFFSTPCNRCTLKNKEDI